MYDCILRNFLRMAIPEFWSLQSYSAEWYYCHVDREEAIDQSSACNKTAQIMRWVRRRGPSPLHTDLLDCEKGLSEVSVKLYQYLRISLECGFHFNRIRPLIAYILKDLLIENYKLGTIATSKAILATQKVHLHQDVHAISRPSRTVEVRHIRLHMCGLFSIYSALCSTVVVGKFQKYALKRFPLSLMK